MNSVWIGELKKTDAFVRHSASGLFPLLLFFARIFCHLHRCCLPFSVSVQLPSIWRNYLCILNQVNFERVLYASPWPVLISDLNPSNCVTLESFAGKFFERKKLRLFIYFHFAAKKWMCRNWNRPRCHWILVWMSKQTEWPIWIFMWKPTTVRICWFHRKRIRNRPSKWSHRSTPTVSCFVSCVLFASPQPNREIFPVDLRSFAAVCDRRWHFLLSNLPSRVEFL